MEAAGLDADAGGSKRCRQLSESWNSDHR